MELSLQDREKNNKFFCLGFEKAHFAEIKAKSTKSYRYPTPERNKARRI